MQRFTAMRRIALAPLLVATGCNWVFGLDQTVAIDAAPAEVLPPGPRTTLQWAIATTDGVLDPAPYDPIVVYKPIGSEQLHPEVPSIQVGDYHGLTPAPYDLADGSFEIPYPLRESPHRIVYTLPGESLPHEVQWSVTGAILTVPRTTRFNAAAAPLNAGYRITPIGLTSEPLSPALYTTGVFTYSNELEDFVLNGSEITYRYAQDAQPLTRPGGAPDPDQGDWVLVGDIRFRGSGQESLVGYALTHIKLAPNMMGQPETEPTWISGTANERTLSINDCPANCLPSVNEAETEMRMEMALGDLGGTLGEALAYGVSPSTLLPGFLPGVAPTYLPRPLMLPFLTSTMINTVLTLVDPSDLLGLERVLYAAKTSSRVVDGVTLTSALQCVTNVFVGTIPFPAPLVTNIRLGGTSLSADTTDKVPIAASSSVQKLTFDVEDEHTANDFVVTLYEIKDSKLAPVRVYHVVDTEVNVEGTLLVAEHQYVFGITARNGYGGARQGDYKEAQYPFGESTTFPRTFVIQ